MVKRKIFICKICIIIIWICQKLESVGPIEQKMKLPLPNNSLYEAKEMEEPSSKVSLFKLKNLIKRFIVFIYSYIYFSIFFSRQKFHLISCHKPKNNRCLTKCYQYFSNKVKVYFSNTIYNISAESIQISTSSLHQGDFWQYHKIHFTPNRRWNGWQKRFPQKNNKNCLRPNYIFNV